MSLFRIHEVQDQNNPEIMNQGIICWAMLLDYAFKNNLFLHSEEDVSTAIKKWMLMAAHIIYNSAKDVLHLCKWGLGQITGGEHISHLARREASAVDKMPLINEGTVSLRSYRDLKRVFAGVAKAFNGEKYMICPIGRVTNCGHKAFEDWFSGGNNQLE